MVQAMCRVEDEIKNSQKEAKKKGYTSLSCVMKLRLGCSVCREVFSQPKKEELEIAVGVGTICSPLAQYQLAN